MITVVLRYVLFERSARQSLAWIKEEGDIYLNTHTQVNIIYLIIYLVYLNTHKQPHHKVNKVKTLEY